MGVRGEPSSDWGVFRRLIWQRAIVDRPFRCAFYKTLSSSSNMPKLEIVQNILEPDFDDVSSFHWRSECSIDTVKTAQALIRREDAPVTMRLKFATRYCLEEDVRRLRTMRRTSASSYYLEKDLLRLERRCPLAMLCIRAELCYSMSTDWMRDW
ncbi:hypothetical protein CDAR_374501, partial [Caerostris darwini]